MRLLYVGFTRARDHLILAARAGKKGPAAKWLDELCDGEGRPLLVLPAAPDATGASIVQVRGEGTRVVQVPARWPGAAWHRELPLTAAVSTPRGTRRVQGTVDLLLETPAGVVVIDHKSFPGRASLWPTKAEEFAPQLAAYAHVLRAVGKDVLGLFVHFTIGGGVVGLK